MLYLVGKQIYKLKLPAKWRIYDVFQMLLLEQDSTKKKLMNKFAEMLKFEPGDNKEYNVKAIQNSAIYIKKVNGHLLGLYYLVV